MDKVIGYLSTGQDASLENSLAGGLVAGTRY
jgi:hypothetical protein